MGMIPQDPRMTMMQGQAPNIPDPTMGEQSQIDPSSLPASPQGMGMPPMEPTAPPDPVDALPMIILDYLDFATETRNDKALGAPVRSQVMLQIAQAINYLVPLLPKDDPQAEQDMQLKIAEFEMNTQVKQQELEFKQQEHQMNLQFKEQEMQLKMQEQQMKLQQQEQTHMQKLVQNEQLGEQKVEQAKKAAQAKPTQNPSNKPSN